MRALINILMCSICDMRRARQAVFEAEEIIDEETLDEERLDELTYRDLISDIKLKKMPYRDWEPLLRQVQYQGYRRDVFNFFIQNKYNGWDVYIRFKQFYDIVSDHSIKAVEGARLLIWAGDLEFHCNCPAYTFWGHAYVMTQLDAAIFPEMRFPRIRNPELKGTVCKHGRKTMRVLPFHLGNIATAIKQTRARLARGDKPPKTPSG